MSSLIIQKREIVSKLFGENLLFTHLAYTSAAFKLSYKSAEATKTYATYKNN